MRWYQVDSDTPNDPKIRRLLDEAIRLSAVAGRDGRLDAAAAMGHLFLIWCFVANHGAQPGYGVKADGRPLDLSDLTYAALFDTGDDLRAFLDDLAERGLIGKDEWAQGIVFLPAMKARADAYAKSKGRGPGGEPEPGRGKAGRSGGSRAPAGPTGPIHNTTRQDTTPEDPDPSAPAVPDLLADGGEDNVDALVRIWNAGRVPGPHVRDITPQRRAAYGRALKAKPDLNHWRIVIQWLNRQKWCNAGGGENHPTWRADLDWLAKPGQLAKYLDKALMERPARADGTTGRDAARGRTGSKRGEFAAALEGGDDDGGKVH